MEENRRNYKKIEELQKRMDRERFCRYPDTNVRDILIDYEREPYINKHGLYFRLTFDQNLSCINLNNKLNKNILDKSIECKSGFTILEVKFERSIPLWFHRIIQSYNLRRQSISKFVLGMCYAKLGTETSD